MRLINRATRQAVLAGAAAVVTATGVTILGALTAPAQAAGAEGAYTCTGNGLGQSVPVSVAVTGTLPPSAHVGDAMTLDNFQVTATVSSNVVNNLLGALGVERFRGSFSSFPITATADDGTIHGTVNPGSDGRMPIDDVAVTSGQDLTFTSPRAGIDVGTFPAEIPGTTTLSAGNFSLSLDTTLAGLLPGRHIELNCTGAVSQIARTSVQVQPTPPPPTHGGTGTGSVGNGGGTDTNGGTQGGSNGGTGGGASAPTGGAGHSGTTQGRGTLANTGVSNTVPMTATGSLLVLLGAGLLYSSRRWRPRVAAGVTEGAEDVES